MEIMFGYNKLHCFYLSKSPMSQKKLSRCYVLIQLILHLALLVPSASARMNQDPTETGPPSLLIRVTSETRSGAQILWLTAPRVRHMFSACWLHYGPLTGEDHVQTKMKPSESLMVLDHLKQSTTYYAFLSCRHGNKPLPSNTVHFTPHGPENETTLIVDKEPQHLVETQNDEKEVPLEKQLPLAPRQEPLHVSKAHIHSSSASSTRWAAGAGGIHPPEYPAKEEEGILVRMNERHMNRPRRDPHNSSPPTRLVLGAICGVVGFLIINVTVVIAVRQYSDKRARRRRLLELQLQQHGGFIYNLEDLINA